MRAVDTDPFMGHIAEADEIGAVCTLYLALAIVEVVGPFTRILDIRDSEHSFRGAVVARFNLIAEGCAAPDGEGVHQLPLHIIYAESHVAFIYDDEGRLLIFRNLVVVPILHQKYAYVWQYHGYYANYDDKPLSCHSTTKVPSV